MLDSWHLICHLLNQWNIGSSGLRVLKIVFSVAGTNDPLSPDLIYWKKMKNKCFACPYLYPENEHGTSKSIKRQEAKQTLRFRSNLFKVSIFFDVFFLLRKPPWPNVENSMGKSPLSSSKSDGFFAVSLGWECNMATGGELQKTINRLPSFEVGFTKNSPNQSLGSLS